MFSTSSLGCLPLYPSCPGQAGDTGERGAPEALGWWDAAACGMERARTGVFKWGEDWVLRGSPLAWGGCLGWVPLCLRPLPTRRGSWILHCAGVPLSSLAFHIPQPCSCMCSFALTFIFFKQILAIYLNNWFSSRRTHRVVGDGERGPREAGGGPGVYVYPPVALCLIPATGSD